MNSILMWIFSKTEIGKMLDGKKTIIGAAFILLANVLEGLKAIAPMFPQTAWIGAAITGIDQFVNAVAPVCDTLGITAITVGLIHKAVKSKA